MNIAQPTALDRIIGFFDPRAALRRIVARTQLQRAYEAAGPRDSWRPRRGGASAQADHMADATKLRYKARSLYQNVPYVTASVEARVDNIIGAGIGMRFTGPSADVLNTMYAQWSGECDADGQLDINGIEAASNRAMDIDGEVLVRLRPRRVEDGFSVPFQLQVLEIDWLDSTRNSLIGGMAPDMPAGNIIIEGIEYDPVGRVAAYWLWDQHPGDTTLIRGLRNFSKRLPAQIAGIPTIIHLFDPLRPGQRRGITRLASIIARVRDLQLYEDAVLARKNLETRLSVLVSGDASILANENQVDASSRAADSAVARATGDLGELRSGGITELPAGVNITTLDPKGSPAGAESQYLSDNLHIITSAVGVTYEMATGDMSGVNFSSARVRRMDVIRGFERAQWHVVIPRLLRPIADAFVQYAVLAGKVRQNVKYGVEFDPPKWDYVNPLQETQADALQVANGLTSLSAKIRARGDDPQKVFQEWGDDFEALAKREVRPGVSMLDVLFFLQKGTLRITDQTDAQLTGDPADATSAKK